MLNVTFRRFDIWRLHEGFTTLIFTPVSNFAFVTSLIFVIQFSSGRQQGMPVRERALQSHLLVAAIDFGTTYSGYTFQSRADFEENPLKVKLIVLVNYQRLKLLNFVV